MEFFRNSLHELHNKGFLSVRKYFFNQLFMSCWEYLGPFIQVPGPSHLTMCHSGWLEVLTILIPTAWEPPENRYISEPRIKALYSMRPEHVPNVPHDYSINIVKNTKGILLLDNLPTFQRYNYTRRSTVAVFSNLCNLGIWRVIYLTQTCWYRAL